ncbi:hypothetical protein C8J56DRAFT_900451 [Mycena floridula]|nr:hypothetical protein C8J56DRAFT_900451 [Mycena floridula]
MLFLKEYREEKFGFSSDDIWPEIEEVIDQENIVNTFSVGLVNEQKQAIVIHRGMDDGTGSWFCHKECGKRIRCDHVCCSQDALQCLVHLDPKAKDERSDQDAANALPVTLASMEEEAKRTYIKYHALAVSIWECMMSNAQERRPRP